MKPYPWPTPPNESKAPIWTGQGFVLGDKQVPILSYEGGTSGWTNDLTAFHEETAGANHFIDLSSRRHALGQLEKYLKAPSPVILEVGCSSGFMLRSICEKMSDVFLIGSDYVAGPLIELATKLPDIPLLQFDLPRCPLPDRSIDAVVMLNVLEHIQDDFTAVCQVFRILKPGGIAVLEAPAGPHLYDIYDKLLMHQRRYSLFQLRFLLQKAAFKILSQSHLGFFLYPGFWWVKRRNQKNGFKEEITQMKAVAKNIRTTKESRLLATLLRLELILGKRLSYPRGIRCLITCQKPL